MTTMSKCHFTHVSRRKLLQNAACGAGAITLLGTAGGARAAAKVSQKSVAYQESPKGTQSCGNCNVFEAPSACKTVEGTVSPQGWCKIWQPKKA
jgi:hypothetical protein